MTWAATELTISPLPLWAQISDRLRASIDAGEYMPGDVLPSETELNARFGVSRTTGRAALNKLASEGLIIRRSGKGSIVCARVVEQPLNLLSSFTDDMKDRGLVPGYGETSVTVTTATGIVASELGVASGTPVTRIERLYLADGKPIAHSVSWLSPSVVLIGAIPTATEFSASPLYKWIEENTGVRVAAGVEIIEGGIADVVLAKQLQVAVGSALLVARRTARAADGRPVEFVERQYRADRYRFRIELVRP